MGVEIIIISGRSGSGKTSVAFEVCEQLRQRDLPHANINTDFLDDVWPEENGAELFLKNLAAIWSNFYHLRGCPRLILSGTSIVTETESVRQTIERTCNASNEFGKGYVHLRVHAFILNASDSVAFERLKAREIGTALDRHVASSNKWDKLYRDFPGWAYRVSTNGRRVEDIAAEVLETAGWLERN